MFRVSQWFGENPEYYSRFGLPGHEGLDLPCASGTALYAVVEGIVYLTTENEGNYGIQVRIDHGSGYKTIYAHLERVNVAEGQSVKPGDIIGFADNTGNSNGNHLHLSVKTDNKTYSDPNGTQWPFNFHDPWPYLQRLYQSWLDKNSITGFLYASSVKLNQQKTYGRVLGTLNIRHQANSSSQILGKVTYGSVVKIISPMINNYYQVQTPVDIPVESGYIYNGIPVIFKPIIEAPADDWRWQTVKPMIDNLGIGVKFKSDGVNPDYYQYYRQHSFLPIRLFFQAHSYIAPETLYNDTWKSQIAKFYNQGGRDFELFNEPNIEGNGIFWTNGSAYANYMKPICQWIKNDFPQTRIWFTAMSPGVPFSNQYFWTDKAWPVLKPFCYGFCIHAYSGNNHNVDTAVNEIVQQIDAVRERYNLQVPLFISECSVNRGTNYQQKAQVYKQLESVLQSKKGIQSVSYFISDWYSPPSEQSNHGESWYKTSLPDYYLQYKHLLFSRCLY